MSRGPRGKSLALGTRTRQTIRSLPDVLRNSESTTAAAAEAEISVLMAVQNAEWTIVAAVRSILLQTFRKFELIIVDTTVQENAIAHPVDRRLLEIAHHKVVIAAKRAGIVLKQTYA